MIPQKILITTALLVVLTILFPPFESVHPNGGSSNAGYSLIFLPPKGHWGIGIVNIAMLFTEWLAVLVLAFIWWLIECANKVEDKVTHGQANHRNLVQKIKDSKLKLTSKIDSKEIGLKACSLVARMGVFIALTIALWFCVLAVDLILIPLAIESSSTAAHPPDYKPTVTVPAVIMFGLSTAVLYKSVVSRKSTKVLLRALVFYTACNAIAVGLMLAGEAGIAPVFRWAGLTGLLLYFLVIKPFKKSWVENFNPG